MKNYENEARERWGNTAASTDYEILKSKRPVRQKSDSACPVVVCMVCYCCFSFFFASLASFFASLAICASSSSVGASGSTTGGLI